MQGAGSEDEEEAGFPRPIRKRRVSAVCRAASPPRTRPSFWRTSPVTAATATGHCSASSVGRASPLAPPSAATASSATACATRPLSLRPPTWTASQTAAAVVSSARTPRGQQRRPRGLRGRRRRGRRRRARARARCAAGASTRPPTSTRTSELTAWPSSPLTRLTNPSEKKRVRREIHATRKKEVCICLFFFTQEPLYP